MSRRWSRGEVWTCSDLIDWICLLWSKVSAMLWWISIDSDVIENRAKWKSLCSDSEGILFK